MTYFNLRLMVNSFDESFINIQNKLVKIPYDSNIYLKDILYKVYKIHVKVASYNDTILFNVYKNNQSIDGQFKLDHGIFTTASFLTQINNFYNQVNKLLGKSVVDCTGGVFACNEEDLVIDIHFKSQVIASLFGFNAMVNKKINLKSINGKLLSSISTADSAMLLVLHFDSVGLKSIDPFEHRSINIVDSFVHYPSTVFNIGDWHYYRNTVPFYTSINNTQFDVSIQEFHCTVTTHDLHPVYMEPGSVISIGIESNQNINLLS